MDGRTLLTVIDALVEYGIQGTPGQGDAAVAALRGIGCGTAAALLDERLSPGRALAHVGADYSGRVAS